jgi:hypothetical protein
MSETAALPPVDESLTQVGTNAESPTQVGTNAESLPQVGTNAESPTQVGTNAESPALVGPTQLPGTNAETLLLENLLEQIGELRRSLKDLTDDVNVLRQVMAREGAGRIPDCLPLDHRRYTWKKNTEPSLGDFIKENLNQDSKTTEDRILAETDGYVRFRKKQNEPRSFLSWLADLESQTEGDRSIGEEDESAAAAAGGAADRADSEGGASE